MHGWARDIGDISSFPSHIYVVSSHKISGICYSLFISSLCRGQRAALGKSGNMPSEYMPFARYFSLKKLEYIKNRSAPTQNNYYQTSKFDFTT